MPPGRVSLMSGMSVLPNGAAIRRRHGRARLALKRAGEGLEIRQRQIDSGLFWRMGVRQVLRRHLRRGLAAPELTVRNEELLRRSETGNEGAGLAVHLRGAIGRLDATVVGDVLAQRDLPVDMCRNGPGGRISDAR